MRKFSAKLPFSNNKLQTGSTKLTNDNTEKNSDQLSLQMVGAWRCAANTVEAVWRGKDKPTLLVECFYDLLTACQYFLPTANGGCDVTGNWWEPAGLAGEKNTASSNMNSRHHIK